MPPAPHLPEPSLPEPDKGAAPKPAVTAAPGISAAVVTHIDDDGNPGHGAPYSPEYGDVYHAAAGAWAQARHVFLGGNGLPGRWQGRGRFVILETGFGLGNNFLATWAAWRADPARCARLVFISIEKHPLTLDDLRRVHAAAGAGAGGQEPQAAELAERLCEAWPPLTPGLHVLDFDEPGIDGGVTLMLALGDIAQVLPRLMARVDAFYLDGFAPARNPAMWDPALLSRLDRWAAPGATAATWSAARPVRDALQHAGFEVEKTAGFAGKRDMTRARFAPRHMPPPLPGGLWPQPGTDCRHALVVGAGLAGCAAAWALTREGWRVTLLDRHDRPACEASGNPGGLFHGIVHAQDGPHARAHRAAALLTARVVKPWLAAGALDGQCDGLLRLDARTSPEEADKLLQRLGLPPRYARWVDRDEAAGTTGLEVPSGGWLFAEGGWLHPAGYAAALLEAARDTGRLDWRPCSTAATVQRRDDGNWCVLDEAGRAVGQAPTLVIANGQGAQALMEAAMEGGTRAGAMAGGDAQPAATPRTPRITDVSWAPPLTSVRGQVTVWPAGSSSLHGPVPSGKPAEPDAAGARLPAIPVAGGGYALALPDGRLLCGATTQHGDASPACREQDHRHNLGQAVRLGALPPQAEHAPLPSSLNGRVGWRAVTPDRLPLIGALPCPLPTPASEQVRRIPRLRDDHGGVFVFAGLGSRGITWAALGGRLLAHWITGAPSPVEADLRDALDPARFLARRQRRPQGNADGPAVE